MTYKTIAERAHDALLDRAIAAEKERDEAIQRATDAIEAADRALEVVQERDRTIVTLRAGLERQKESRAAQGAVTHGNNGGAS